MDVGKITQPGQEMSVSKDLWQTILGKKISTFPDFSKIIQKQTIFWLSQDEALELRSNVIKLGLFSSSPLGIGKGCLVLWAIVPEIGLNLYVFIFTQ